jgi:hypothetical protein
VWLLAILAVENQSNVLLEKNERRKDTNPGGLLLKYSTSMNKDTI